MFYKKLRIFLFLLTFFLFFIPKASAAQNFYTSYNVTYNLTQTPITHVVTNISLKNNTSQYFASSYKIQFGFSDMKNLSVVENGQKVPFKIIPNDNGTQIEINFNDKVVGIGKTRNFILYFDTSQISQNQGTVWEVNIPGVQKYSSIDDLNATINFPQKMGKIAYLKPVISNLKFDGKTLILNNDEIKDSGLSIAFGDYQVYDLNLTYHLKNNNFFPIESSIALPPNTSYQDVLINSIIPKPENVQKDFDGNWIATYKLPPAKNIDVKVEGKVRNLLTPRKESISSEQIKNYLKAENFWEVDDPKIIALAKKLRTPKAIYDYTVSTLTYDFSRVKNNQQRLGASEVLSDPNSATCWEFSDLFITLSRAAGIPARELNGFAYTNNFKERPLSLVEDVLHAWPQYYDSTLGKWVDIDPTWENTTSGVDYFKTLDFDHIAFVIQGSDSSSPKPPGGINDIRIAPSKDFDQKLSSLSIEQNPQKKYISGFPMTQEIKIENAGNSITSATSILVTDGLISSVQNIKVSQIPPFGHEVIQVPLGRVNFLTKYEGMVKIQLGNAVFQNAFKATPVFNNINFYIGGIIIGILIIGLFIGIRRSRGLSSQK